jgi:DNA-3-methyladenine glycosylase I
VLRKREAFRKAFRGFEPARVARYGEADVTRLLGNPEIIRSRAKIDATIAGARIYEEMRRIGEDFSPFVWNLAGGKPIKNKTGQVPAKTPLPKRSQRRSKSEVSSSLGRSLFTPGCRRRAW